MSEAIQGTCHCKTVRFEITEPVDFCSNCHCEDCRLTHASAFVTWTSVPKDRFKLISGREKLTRYESHPGVFWSFCSKCGSSMLYDAVSEPGKVYLTAASLSMDQMPTPDSHVSYEERVPWFSKIATLPCFKEKSEERLPFEG